MLAITEEGYELVDMLETSHCGDYYNYQGV